MANLRMVQECRGRCNKRSNCEEQRQAGEVQPKLYFAHPGIQGSCARSLAMQQERGAPPGCGTAMSVNVNG